MKKYFMLIPILITFVSCRNMLTSIYSSDKGMPGNAHFKYTYTNSNLKPLDTLLLDGLVTNVNSYQGATDQEYFTLQQFDSVKNILVNRKILTEYIIYGKIRSLDNKDSLEYIYHARYGWRVVKRRNNVTLLYRSYEIPYNNNVGTDFYNGIYHYDIVSVVRNGKAVSGLSSLNYDRGSLLKVINSKYKQKFRKKDFKDIDEITDYIMYMETKNTMY